MIMLVVLLVTFGFVAQAQTSMGVRLILGLTDNAETKWDGSVSAVGARIASIEPWRFDGDDNLVGADSWRVSTHRIRLFGRNSGRSFVGNGVIVWLTDANENAQLNVKTAQGDFAIQFADVPYGKVIHTLSGRVMADRVPPAMQITKTPEEQDYPAAATDKNGNIWMAYIEFKHSKDHNALRANFTEEPKDLTPLKDSTGGDQVLLRKYSQGSWGEPIAITPAGGDLYRTAVAVDGSGRPWVFWSANEKQNFEVWARVVENGKPSANVRLTNAAGSDVDPVAVTDAKGRVWVAWQGWRNGKASIYTARQSGNSFSAPAAVTTSGGNEWNPAIAADGAGRVSVAWDSYRNGNYDVYVRTASALGKWGREIPVAATARYEAYPSIAYDRQGRLWVAYEEGAERWGKDFGAYETSGIAVYQGRAIRIAGVDAAGNRLEIKTDPTALLPGVPQDRVDITAKQNDSMDWLKPDPSNARDRQPSRTATNVSAPKNTMPRLTVDGSGRLWMAFRSAHPIWWNPVGTVWSEYVVSCDGSQCTGPIFLTHSDNLLENRPALASVRGGELMVVGSSDSRRQFYLSERATARREPRMNARAVPDPYNNDVYANVVSLSPGGEIAAQAAGGFPVPAGDPADAAEKASVAAMHKYRLKTRYGTLQLVRGEFHRHSEISADGGNDGTIIDQWRYMLDPGRMDWVGCCDHDNGGGREYSWWITQKLTDVFYSPGHFVPMFSYERSVSYPEGHRNVVMVQRGVRPLPRLPKVNPSTPGHAPDTLMLYRYLRQFDAIVASHTSGTNMGTDWRDNDPAIEPVVEIYQGIRQNYEMPEAPRSNSADDSIGGWRPKGFVNLALEMGYKLAFQSSSDHISTHMSYCNLYATAPTREAVLDAFKKRHVYGATDNILADFESGGHMMGDAFSTASHPELRVKLTGTAPFAKVHVIKDNKYVYTIEPNGAQVDFTWRDGTPESGKTSYYYVRGEQQDGEIVWVSPMWITYTGK